MHILFASQIEPADRWLPLLRQALPQDDFILEPGRSVDVALIAHPPKGTLERLSGARLVQSLWMGVEKLVADPAYPRSVPLARLVDPGMVAAMSETVLYHVLDWHRRQYRYREHQQTARWHRYRQYLASDHTIGILGLGELGRDAARKLLALGFNVAGWSRRPKNVSGVQCSTDLSFVLERSNVVVCLLPVTPQTRGILSSENLKRIRKGGGLINVARGPHVVVPDLIAALDSGHLAHAYLDVFDEEPLPPQSPLWRHPRITITPHAAALTEPRTAIRAIVDNVERVRRGEKPLNLVDFEAGY